MMIDFLKSPRIKFFSFKRFLRNFVAAAFGTFFASAFISCEYYDLPVKAYFEENSSAAYFSGYSMSVSPAAVDSDGFPCIGSQQDLVITYSIANSSNLPLKAELSFPSESGATSENTSFSLSGSTAVLRIEKSLLAALDGDIEKFDISPTVNLFAAKSDQVFSRADSKSISLRCNTVPSEISNAVPMMYSGSSSFHENLVVCLELPAENTDAKTLTVYGRSFSLESDGSPAQDSSGWTLYKNSFPLGALSVSASESNSKFEYSAKNGGTSYFVLTDISDLLSRDVFSIGIKVSDKGGLESPEHIISSKIIKLDPPVLKNNSSIVSQNAEIAQDSGEDYASFELSGAGGSSISYVVSDSSGTEVLRGSGSSPLSFSLYPDEDGGARSYVVKAAASGGYALDSDEFSVNLSVKGSALSLNSNLDDSQGGSVFAGSGGTFTYRLIPSSDGKLIYTIKKGAETKFSSSDSINGDAVDADGLLFSLDAGDYTVEAVFKKPYHVKAEFSQAVTVTSSQGGGVSIETPAVSFFAFCSSESNGERYTIEAMNGNESITSEISSWNIYVSSGGIKLASGLIAAGNSVLIPSGFKKENCAIEITAVYGGKTYSDSIPLR